MKYMYIYIYTYTYVYIYIYISSIDIKVVIRWKLPCWKSQTGETCPTGLQVEKPAPTSTSSIIIITSWWFQPIWKLFISQDGNLPQIGVKIKNIGNHHLDHYCLIAIIITTMILFNVIHHHHHDRHDHQHHPHPSPWTLLHIINIIWSLCFSHIIDNSPFIYHQESSSITKAQSPPNLPFRPSVYPSCPYVVALI